MTPHHDQQSSAPLTQKDQSEGPLAGVTVIELAGIGPGPYCGQLLADMGAQVIIVDRPGFNMGGDMPSVDKRGKTSLILDLRQDGAADIVLRLVEKADALIEGFRPGVAEKLGVGPAECQRQNPKLVYGRMTGWGQSGPWAKMAGHDINYLSITGALNAIGPAGTPPPPPLNLMGDYGGGSLFLAMGVLAAIVQAQKTGRGEVVDAAIVDGVSSLMGIVHSLKSVGQWSPQRGDNLLDGGAPFYQCYETADQKFMAAGPIEPQFLAEMLRVLDINPEDYGAQHDRTLWAAQKKLLADRFKQKSRDEWSKLFDCVDACVTPVLDYEEAMSHPHNMARDIHQQTPSLTHPHSAPRFSSYSGKKEAALAQKGGDTDDILKGFGFNDTEIASLIEKNIITRGV